MGRTTDAPQVSLKTSPHESFCPDRDSNPRGEGLSGYKPQSPLPLDHGRPLDVFDSWDQTFQNLDLPALTNLDHDTKQVVLISMYVN